MSTKLCYFCHKPIQISGGGMSNHIKKSATCYEKFQALMNLVQYHDATTSTTSWQSTSISNLPMDAGNESTAMELDITPTDTDQLEEVDVGATTGTHEVDDPPLIIITLIANPP